MAAFLANISNTALIDFTRESLLDGNGNGMIGIRFSMGSNGKDNFAAYVKIYWRVESDSTLPIDEYYFVRPEHRFAINGSYSATQLNAWNIARILSAWEDDRCNGS